MKYADVRLRQPDWMLHPMQRFIREGDAVTYEEMVTWDLRPDRGVEYVLFYVEADLERYRAAVAEADSIRECRIVPIDDGSAHVWACQETRPEDRAWREAFADRRLVLVPPVRFDDEAAMEMTIVGDGAAIGAVLETLPSDVEVTVNEVGTYDRRGGTLAGGLTDRQREAVATALALGYYEVPRTASQAAVAAALGCAESTASELLRRAERTVLSRAIGRYGGRVEGAAGTAPERGSRPGSDS